MLTKCKPDNNGRCPPGLSHNAHDNCFPSGKCPSEFSSKHEDESGKCFPDKQTPLNQIIVIHKQSIQVGSSSGLHSPSKGCIDAIKIAWLGKIPVGQNHVDQFIDNCLGVH